MAEKHGMANSSTGLKIGQNWKPHRSNRVETMMRQPAIKGKVIVVRGQIPRKRLKRSYA